MSTTDPLRIPAHSFVIQPLTNTPHQHVVFDCLGNLCHTCSWKSPHASIDSEGDTQIHLNGFRSQHVQRYITDGQISKMWMCTQGRKLNKNRKVLKINRKQIKTCNNGMSISDNV